MSDNRPTVLLVDDDPWLLAAARAMLSEDELRVLTTADPMQALPLIEWEDVDVLVSDVSMPQVSGVDLVARARQLFPHVTRVIVTGRPNLEGALKAINEGWVFRFLVKPVDQNLLRETLRLAAAQSRQLRRQQVVEKAIARREAALAELFGTHPGLAEVPLPGRPHVISEERVSELGAREWPVALTGLGLGLLGYRPPALPSPRASVPWSDPRTTPLVPPAPEASIDGDLDELRRGYVAQLPARLQTMAVDMGGGPGCEGLAAARAAAHALRGTAGTYGLAEVAAAADAMERALDEAIDGRADARVEARRRAEAGLRELERVVDEARRAWPVLPSTATPRPRR
jgi:FixJ family two-component response regulator